MKTVPTVVAAMLFAALVLGNLFCSTGEEPEVVVVPVGEPGNGDPFDSDGDMGCGGSTEAQVIEGTMVLVAFQGTHDTWLVYLSKADFVTVLERMNEAGDWTEYEDMTPAQVDELHRGFCGSPESRTPKEQQLYDIVAGVLGSEIQEIAHDVCR
jgi:hypothetical protein